MKTTILIVDDDREIAELIQFYLENEGYNVLKGYDGEEALTIIAEKSIDLLILDVMMPKIDGLEVCKKVREKHPIPILMLSAKVEDMDKIVGLMTGADDYMGKPFNPLEVVARVKALLRRVHMQMKSTESTTDQLFIHSLVINKKNHVVQVEGKKVNLTPIEFDILYLLASRPSRVFSSEEIFEHVWNEEAYGISKTVMIHISNLRKKLEDATNGEKIIQTVWGVGYKIDA
ncbi:response regulator transcription factor [Pseudogracilibacillus auburnensis]|uniref:DNA-binding response OmpR family regulator n=1 Tax=Pseudogracilibacillus auburnensis TaxID=1494959 RepID=A0A2V3W4G4_9BACI|nr:response regulator transcription factor [Pseudogracilibacillus auburnensis]MBO1004855.1 response regulator transcription factor [Pseudogracilibacillus auburnensis]PXW88074.1 DNA-binding response OmpR family regulator [Pseudogracilibacillus auburnensis]